MKALLKARLSSGFVSGPAESESWTQPLMHDGSR